MEGVEGGAGDKSRLVRDPQVTDRIEGIGKDNSLKTGQISRLVIEDTRESAGPAYSVA